MRLDLVKNPFGSTRPGSSQRWRLSGESHNGEAFPASRLSFYPILIQSHVSVKCKDTECLPCARQQEGPFNIPNFTATHPHGAGEETGSERGRDWPKPSWIVGGRTGTQTHFHQAPKGMISTHTHLPGEHYGIFFHQAHPLPENLDNSENKVASAPLAGLPTLSKKKDLWTRCIFWNRPKPFEGEAVSCGSLITAAEGRWVQPFRV